MQKTLEPALRKASKEMGMCLQRRISVLIASHQSDIQHRTIGACPDGVPLWTLGMYDWGQKEISRGEATHLSSPPE